jgi:hypothetical protein
MNGETASCGHLVPAWGAPNSLARLLVKSLPCERCKSERDRKTDDAFRVVGEAMMKIVTDAIRVPPELLSPALEYQPNDPMMPTAPPAETTGREPMLPTKSRPIFAQMDGRGDR